MTFTGTPVEVAYGEFMRLCARLLEALLIEAIHFKTRAGSLFKCLSCRNICVCEPPPFDKANASKCKSCLANILLSVVACNPLTTSCQLRRQQLAGKKVADEYKSVLI